MPNNYIIDILFNCKIYAYNIFSTFECFNQVMIHKKKKPV